MAVVRGGQMISDLQPHQMTLTGFHIWHCLEILVLRMDIQFHSCRMKHNVACIMPCFTSVTLPMTWIGYGITAIMRPQKEVPWFDPSDIFLKLLHFHIFITQVLSYCANGKADYMISAVGWLTWAAEAWR